MSFFDEAVQHVLDVEGGYTNDPNDRGGATNFGITIDELRKYRNNQALTPDDVKNMSQSEAKDIYKKMYWSPYMLDQFQDKSLAIAMFDQVVNRGPSRAIKNLQSALNLSGANLGIDGVIGPKTIDALNKADAKLVLKNMIKIAQLAYISIVVNDTTQLKFLKGWINRTHFLIDLI